MNGKKEPCEPLLRDDKITNYEWLESGQTGKPSKNRSDVGQIPIGLRWDFENVP
jgi:hypothetical protein